jgi:DTW domain-containing protein YfiP
VLFPDTNASSELPADIEEIIAIDGTWCFARQIYKRNLWLHSLPKLKLSSADTKIFSALRKPPKDSYLSTAEAISCVFRMKGEIEVANTIQDSLNYATEKEVSIRDQKMKEKVNTSLSRE